MFRKRALYLVALLPVSPYRVAKTHRMPYLYRSFSAKEPYNEYTGWLIMRIVIPEKRMSPMMSD